MTLKFKWRKLWVFYFSPAYFVLFTVAGVLLALPLARLMPLSWVVLAFAALSFLAATRLISFEPRTPIILREYVAFIPIKRLETTSFGVYASVDDWEDDEVGIRLTQLDEGEFYTCDKPDEVADWVNANLSPPFDS